MIELIYLHSHTLVLSKQWTLLYKAKALETYFTFEKTDIYTLKAEYVDFVGNYKVEVFKTAWGFILYQI